MSNGERWPGHPAASGAIHANPPTQEPMRLLLSAADLGQKLAAAQERELQALAWCCGLALSGAAPEERGSLLSGLVSRAEAASPDTRRLVLDHVAEHAEEMTPEGQAAFLGLYERTRAGSEGGREALARLRRRLSPEPPPSAAARPAGAPRPRGDAPLVGLVIPEYLSANTFLQPDVGVLLAAARLRAAGYRVVLVDNRVARLSMDELAQRVEGADVLVVTTTPYDHIQNYFLDYRLRYAFKTINALAARCPGAKVVVCGAHGTVRPDIVLRDTRADLVLKGEYDTGVVPLVDALFHGDPAALPEVVTRDARPAGAPGGDGALHPHRLVQLDGRFRRRDVAGDDVLPAYDLVDLDDYYGDEYVENRPRRRPRWATVLATRGCAYDCSYCYNFWGRRVRYREPESVLRELAWLRDEHGVRDVFFLDFHFTQDVDWVARFCALARERALGVRWSAQLRSDAAPADLLLDMAAAGCEHLWFGVESFDAGMIRSMEKYRDDGASVTAIDRCRRAGIEPHLFIMIGMPGETRASINATISAMHAAKAPYCGVMLATPRFGTEHYRLAKEQFPALGGDFYSLRSVRGLVGNDLEPADLRAAMAIFDSRDFIYRSSPPEL